MGYSLSINKMLKILSEVQQVVTAFPEKDNNKERKCSSLSSKSKKGTDIVSKLDLENIWLVCNTVANSETHVIRVSRVDIK